VFFCYNKNKETVKNMKKIINQTRQKLIDITFEEVYEKGFQSASLTEILAKASVHKGSMYYFFASKKEMAMVALREKMEDRFHNKYGKIATLDKNLITELFNLLKDLTLRDFKRGCPLANIVQEMSNLDEDFNAMSKEFYKSFKDVIKSILDKAILVNELILCDTNKISLYITVVIEGAILAAKASENPKDYLDSIECLQDYINFFLVK
jgi:TetR/AcrR family transcriptional regulator, transcriptional repressor for nem operon